MSTTKKDFQAIAGILRARAQATEGHEARETVYAVAGDLADYFADQNPKFDYGRFEAAVRRGAE